jgi:hypothetical protein
VNGKKGLPRNIGTQLLPGILSTVDLFSHGFFQFSVPIY